jgi:hypothetical protein
VVLPLPAGHPMFNTVFEIKLFSQLTEPQLGLIFRGPSGREIVRLYLLQSIPWSNQYEAQKLFRLPLVRRVLSRKSTEEIWKDLFSMKIEGWDLPWETMVYNLYILHLRSTLLPANTIAYGLINQNNMAYVEIPSRNKDYRTELIFSFDRGLLLSYLLVTDRNSADSREMRSRFITGINFRASDKSLTPLIYREFKNLSFVRQTDQEGMLYLVSAWSHDMNNLEMLKEIIYFLERGNNNHEQLKPFYRYAYNRYKRTFTTRDVFTELDDPDIKLQRKIELEEVQLRTKLQERPKVVPTVELTGKERMDEMIRRAKDEKVKNPTKKKRDKLIVH